MADLTSPQADLVRTFVDGLVKGEPDQVRSVFSGPADIDDPFAGRHIDGGFEQMVRNWGPAKIARIKSTHLDHVTIGKDGKFIGAEVSLNLDKNGEDKLVNAVIVMEMDGNKAVRSRLYYRRARVDGLQHVRNRILDDKLGLEPYMPALQRYQDALTAGDANAQADSFSPDGRLDGHGEHTDMTKGIGMGIYDGRETIREALVQMFGIIDHDAGGSDSGQHGANIEKMNGFTDGTTYVLEFNIIDPNHPTNRVHAGIACYEIGEDQLLKEARVYDEAW